jgi:spore germination protein GerM
VQLRSANALTALLSDVTEAESEMGLSSAIPEGTALLGVGVANGIASIDLSRESESGGGSLSVLGRVAQVVYTATWFEDIDAVEFLIEGVPVDVLTGRV